MDVGKYQTSDELRILMLKSVGTLIYYVFYTHLYSSVSNCLQFHNMM